MSSLSRCHMQTVDLLDIFFLITVLSFKNPLALFVSKYIYFLICIAAGSDYGSDNMHLFIFSDNSASGTAQCPKAYHSAEAN